MSIYAEPLIRIGNTCREVKIPSLLKYIELVLPNQRNEYFFCSLISNGWKVRLNKLCIHADDRPQTNVYMNIACFSLDSLG